MISHCHRYELQDPSGKVIETSSEFEYLKGLRDLYNRAAPGHKVIWVR